MTDKNRAFEEERVREQAKRLQEARLALGLTIHDFVQPLSTSRSQLDAIERGNVDAFYAPFYYERLFRRYAEVLSFSPEAIDEMVQRFSPDAPQDPANADLPSDEAWAQGATAGPSSVESDGVGREGATESLWGASSGGTQSATESGSTQTSEGSEASPKSGSEKARSNTASLNRLTSAAAEQSAKGDQSSNWGIIAAFGLLAAGVVVALIVANSDDDRVPAKAPDAPAPAASPADNPNPQAESSGAQPAGQASGQPASNTASPAKPAAAGVTTPPAAATPNTAAAAPAKSAPTAAPTATPTSPIQATPPAPAKAASPSAAPAQTPAASATPTPATTPAAPGPTQNNVSNPAAPAAAPSSPPAPAKSSTPGPSSSAPAMEVTPKARTWIWVREADEKVREFGVAAGEKVVFQDMPIYFVIARPGESDIKIQGKSVRLPRTDQERDIGRYGRSQLIEAKPASAN